MREFVIFMLVLLSTATLLAGSITVIYPEGISLTSVWVHVAIGLTLFLPGLMNLFIFINIRGKEDSVERLCAGIRGTGFLCVGVGLDIALTQKETSILLISIAVITGGLLHISSLIIGDIHDKRKVGPGSSDDEPEHDGV